MADTKYELHEKVAEKARKNLSVLREKSDNVPFYSPSLRELQNGSSRVKKLSKLFEEKSQTYSTKTNWWLEETALPSSPSTTKPLISVGESPVKFATKLERIAYEFLQNEVNYVQALSVGITAYVNVIKAGSSDVPNVLRHQVFKLFGNIENIYEMHKNSVLPRIMLCNGNIQLLAETITSFIRNDLFYCYIIYVMNQKSAEQLISYHSSFFEGLRSFYHDLQGVNSFLIFPIQRLPKLKMFFDEFIKELHQNIPTDVSAIAACCVAEKSVQRLLVRLNESLAVTQILETCQLEPTEQLCILTTLQNKFGTDLNAAMLLVVPKSNSNFTFRSPFNIFDLGKFQKISNVKAYENCTGRNFYSKVFLFEKCLLYTKIISDSAFGYRMHYPFNGPFTFIMSESVLSIRITGSVKKMYDVEFTSENIENIAQIKKIINQFYDQRRSTDFAFTKELMITEDHDMTDDEDWECIKAEAVQDETTCIANSRFYIKSPDGSKP